MLNNVNEMKYLHRLCFVLYDYLLNILNFKVYLAYMPTHRWQSYIKPCLYTILLNILNFKVYLAYMPTHR